MISRSNTISTCKLLLIVFNSIYLLDGQGTHWIPVTRKSRSANTIFHHTAHARLTGPHCAGATAAFKVVPLTAEIKLKLIK